MGESSERQASLLAMLYPGGGYLGAWRRPESPLDFFDVELWRGIAQCAERGKLDGIFLGDQAGLWPFGIDALAHTAWATRWEPITLLSALAGWTTHLGLLATATTTFSEPYTVARQFASLDVISGGRVGWNVVTTANPNVARNYGLDALPHHDERYVRAQEFVDVVQGLWDSWEDDAFIIDKASGRYFDPERLHALNHRGTYFAVAGPLNVPRSPQGQPVIVQAGASPAGRAFAAANAEVVFTAQTSIGAAAEFYAEIKQAAVEAGRDADHVKILPALAPVVGRTQQEAVAKLDALQALLDPTAGLAQVENHLGVDLSGLPLDAPIPEVPLAANQGRQKYLLDKAREENATLGDLVRSYSGIGLVAGTPDSIADQIEEWLNAPACDGFMISPPYLPDGLDEFVDLVVPELQRRGLFRTAYTGKTLRDHLGLPRPANRFSSRAAIS